MQQTPPPGSHRVQHRGDRITFRLRLDEPRAGGGWVRTNLGRSGIWREEVVRHVEERTPLLDRDWHDVPMRAVGEGEFELTLPLLEVGHFEAKAFFLPEGARDPEWPGGENLYLKVEAAVSCRANTIYKAFVRQFGPNKGGERGGSEAVEQLEAQGYTVIPRSGTFRDLAGELDFIIGELGFRILLLLPIHPTPTLYGRMGRFGSPFASLDFLDVDPALAEFDRKTTPLDQFRELVDGVHGRGARVFIDLPVNHTGWASHLHVRHPDWFARNPDETFRSPGAWGVTWEDLLQLDYERVAVWRYMAEVFLFWCREGVDGFRCDAGYMVPQPVWEYVTAVVRQSFPDTVFLLEGLGGKLEVTRDLLRTGGLDWAYSELFQTYDRTQLEHYLPGVIEASGSWGTPVHFAETHDNDRLAARSVDWAWMRTQLSALCSHAGAFGITNGVEWYAADKILVHQANSLSWGAEQNQVADIAWLNALLAGHPAFAAGARLELVQEGDGNVLALARTPAGQGPGVLVLVNLDPDGPQTARWRRTPEAPAGEATIDLRSGERVPLQSGGDFAQLELAASEVICLGQSADECHFAEVGRQSFGICLPAADDQALGAAALEVHALHRGDADFSDLDPAREAADLAADPAAYCARVTGLPRSAVVTRWAWPVDLRREVMLPPGHWLLIEAQRPFRARLCEGERVIADARSLPAQGGTYFALIPPGPVPERPAVRALELAHFGSDGGNRRRAALLALPEGERAQVRRAYEATEADFAEHSALVTNGRGAMAQVRAAWGELRSQYDCLLGGNLHPDVPVDRHVMLTRLRGWLVYRGYSQEVGPDCQQRFGRDADGAVWWDFRVPVGTGRAVPLRFGLRLLEGRNAVEVELLREAAGGRRACIPDDNPVRLILRPDVEDRRAHAKTKAFAGPEEAWPRAVHSSARGFTFQPDSQRRLALELAGANFVSQPEWTYSVPHPEEADRGLGDSSDLFSPGYLELGLVGGQSARLRAEILVGQQPPSAVAGAQPDAAVAAPEPLAFGEAMERAIADFVVARDDSLTVIAGYPWFLDWGRDTLICLRGIIAAGMLEESREILLQFARFEDRGTLPNTIHGEDTSNRDTSDAPLWFFTACADLLEAEGGDDFLERDCGGRNLRRVLRSIAEHYRDGTPNGVRMDPESGLIFSPSHFTWMDTNYPAGTPREGYPVEIQALWHAALVLLERVDPGEGWGALAERVGASVQRYFVRPDFEHLSDCLHAAPGTPAAAAQADDALRSNQLLAITLGCVQDPERAERILRSSQELLVPGAIRSLADRELHPELPVWRAGQLLNDPARPYWGQYRGDEDTRRKAAYHNGTAWGWPFPSYCEALVQVHGSGARRTALALLASCVILADRGCLGQLPEIVDGDLPHAPRGCSAQAWSVTEALRVWNKIR